MSRKKNQPLKEKRFIPLPSNPKELTAEHAKLLFAGDVDAGLREILQMGIGEIERRERMKAEDR